MKTFFTAIAAIILVTLPSCNNSTKTRMASEEQGKVKIYAKEPSDSADYRLLKYDFYLSKSGQLCERKLAMARDSSCEFEVYYDSSFKIDTEDTTIEKPLNTIVDINTFVLLDSTEYSKDRNKVFYFHGNSDGGIRVIVNDADPLTFKRLCEYRWGIDKNHVFYKGTEVEGIRLKYLQVLNPPDKSDPFIQYIKDDKNVYYENRLVNGAETKTFKVVSGQKWDAEDINNKYRFGERIK